MEWGDKVKSLEALERQGIAPKAILERPVLFSGLDLIFTAFQELQSERSIGMSAGPIPWSSIHRWCEVHGCGDQDFLAILASHIRAMEAALNKYMKDKEPKK